MFSAGADLLKPSRVQPCKRSRETLCYYSTPRLTIFLYNYLLCENIRSTLKKKPSEISERTRIVDLNSIALQANMRNLNSVFDLQVQVLLVTI